MLSTCNRVEVYGRGRRGAGAQALDAVPGRLPRPARDELAPCVYRLTGAEAVRHAFRVAASLDSMVIGEPQILGQVKEAYQAAEEAGTLGSIAERAAQPLAGRGQARAHRDRHRRQRGLGLLRRGGAGAEDLRRAEGPATSCWSGAGKMSELAARHLVRSGARATVLGGRTFERAEELAAALGGRAAPFESLREELAVADIVISGTGRAGHRHPARGRGGARGAGAAAASARCSSSTSRCRATSSPRCGELDGRLPLRPRRPEVGGGGQPARAPQGGGRGRGPGRGARSREFLDWQQSLDVVPLLVELRRRARGDPARGDREGPRAAWVR